MMFGHNLRLPYAVQAEFKKAIFSIEALIKKTATKVKALAFKKGGLK